MTVASGTAEGQEPIAQAARIWAEKGFSVVPIRADGSKRPSVEWKTFQQMLPVAGHVRGWFQHNPDLGIAVVCGKVSGNLEMTELEGRATSEEIIEQLFDEVEKLGQAGWFQLLWTDGYVELTPSGGLHFLYRIADHEVPGNEKVARRPATAEELAENPDDKIKVLAETRGEGGYVIVAPTGGAVHPTGLSWQVQAGQIGVVPTITWKQRNQLHAALRTVLDQMPKEEPRERRAVPAAPSTGTRPGDDFNSRADWADILEPHGWTVHHMGGGTTYWTRPGKPKRDGHSATTGHAGAGSADRLYVMSSATDLPTDQPLSKFFVYAHYNHGGDLAAATRELARRDFGQPVAAPARQVHAGGGPQRKVDIDIDSNVDSPATPPRPNLPRRDKRREDWTISGFAHRFVKEQGEFFWYVTEEKMWRVWNGTHWQRDDGHAALSSCVLAITDDMTDEADRLDSQAVADPDRLPLAKALRKHVQAIRNGNRANLFSMIAALRSISAEAFDADPRYLNMRNCIYDMVVDRPLDHDPKYMLTKVSGVDYDPDAKAPRGEVFFADLLPSDSMREFVMQGLGYTLTGEADRKAAFVLQGVSNSGKTQLTELVQGILNDYAVSVSPGTFTKRKEHGPNPELHDMRGARFVYTSETSNDIALDEELVKRVTGKDTMSTRTLYEKNQRWIPQCVLWIATNNLPRFGSDAEAMWRRIKTVRFVNEFTDDGSSGHVAQPNIGRQLADDEGSGIFNLLLSALRRYRIAGRLAEPQELKESVQSHRQETDPVAQWVMVAQERGQLRRAVGSRANQAMMRKAYAAWCADEGFQALAAQRFGIALAQNVNYVKQRSNGETWLIDWEFTGPNWITGMTSWGNPTYNSDG